MSPPAKKRGLGRGLDALLQEEPASSVPVSALEPNRFQPRTAFDDTRLDELAESIRVQGVVQPLVVTPKGGGGYVIVAGERRWRAARKAGLAEVPVVVRQVADDRELLELALVENLQRADLNPVEEAEAYRTLATQFQLSQEEIAGRVGKSRPAVANALRLLNLPPEVQDELRNGRLTAGQARPLLAIADRRRQLALAREAVEGGLTARELEERARSAKGAGSPRRRRKAGGAGASGEETEVFAAAAQEELTRRLQTKVEIRRAGRGGTIRIHFHSEEELMGLYDRLMERGGPR
ncbi:MAG TPA: ParB/RepB/Spo0J family partition protein [Thermoanaerobaculia bacterium]|nr:ParB/RepB/Spo0J family partition protein [Thermoanaerobaculia bacterium]